MTEAGPGADGGRPAPITRVTGGAGGLAATYDRVRALAAVYDGAGNRMRGQAGLGGRTVVNGDLLESALLSPRSFAEAEGAVIAATTGPEGILVGSVGWEADARIIETTVWALESTDDLVREAFALIDRAAMRAAGQALVGGTAILGPAAVAGLALAAARLPVDDLVADRPGLVQHAFNGAGGLLAGLGPGLLPAPFGWLAPPRPSTADAAALLAGFYGRESRHALERTAGATPVEPPGSLADLIRQLAHTNDLPDGSIGIQTIVDADGRRRHIVYLPGTDDMHTVPWDRGDTVRDLPANLLVMSGQDTAYSRGVLDALARAGVQPGEKVALVGHSQGGITALHLAATRSEFDISQVVTAGAPSAQVQLPTEGTSVIAFENKGDVVPLTDGADTPDSQQQVTITFDAQGADLVESHGLAAYTRGAAAADGSDHPSIAHQVAALQEQGFLPGAIEVQESTVQTWQITRDR